MSTALHIDVDDKNLRRALQIAPNRIINAMHTSLTRSAVMTQRYFKETLRSHGNIYTGHLWNSIHFSFKNKLSVTIEPTAPYADDVEKGTPPHKIEIEEIRGWALFHGLNPYAVQKSIRRKGTKAHPYEAETATRAMHFAEKDMQQQLDKAIKEIL